MIDRTTKILMALIALGLWANVSVQVFRPAQVSAQDNSGVLSSMDSKLGSIDGKLGNIESKVNSLESTLGKISTGYCLNGKIC